MAPRFPAEPCVCKDFEDGETIADARLGHFSDAEFVVTTCDSRSGQELHFLNVARGAGLRCWESRQAVRACGRRGFLLMTAEEIAADDRALIITLAEQHQMTEWQRPSGTLISVGDAETFYGLVHEGDGIAFVETQRGHDVVQVRFATLDDAVRYLVFELSDRLPIPSPSFAPGSTYAVQGEDWALTWPGGRAVSPGGRLDPEKAREFSWVATAEPADIADRRVPVLRLRDPLDDRGSGSE